MTANVLRYGLNGNNRSFVLQGDYETYVSSVKEILPTADYNLHRSNGDPAWVVPRTTDNETKIKMLLKKLNLSP